MVLPGIDALTAAPVLHRIRERLLDAVGTALIPEFSVSIGLADSTLVERPHRRPAGRRPRPHGGQGPGPRPPGDRRPARPRRHRPRPAGAGPRSRPEPPACTRRPAGRAGRLVGWVTNPTWPTSCWRPPTCSRPSAPIARSSTRCRPRTGSASSTRRPTPSSPTSRLVAARPRLAAGRRRTPRLQRDEDVLTETGIRRLRDKPVFMTPNVFPPDEPVEPDERPRTNDEQHCYVCKQKYVEIHHFYDQLCPPCAAHQLRQADRDGRPARPGRAAHRWAGEDRLPGRHQAPAGRRIAHRHHPVPRDAALRYSGEADFDEWCDRLEVYGLDLRHTPSVEGLCHHLSTTHPRLDYIVNNACQTVRRPPAFYEHMLELEDGRRWTSSRPAPARCSAALDGVRAPELLGERAPARLDPSAVQRGALPAGAAAGGRGRRRRTCSRRGRSTRTSSRSTCATGTRGGSRCRRCPRWSCSRRSS